MERVTNLAQLLTEHPLSSEEGLLFDGQRTVTAGEARSRAWRLAGELSAGGVRPTEAVALRLATGPEFVIAMVGIWLAGAVLVPISDRLPDDALEAALEATSAAALVDGDGTHRTSSTRRFDPGVAFVTWTSGTTGTPKPILHTHTGYLELLDRVLNPLRAGAARRRSPPSPNLIPVSLSLNAGIYNALFGLRSGAPLVLMSRFDPGDFADLVRRFEIRSTVLPPAAITMLNDDPAITDLSPLRFVRSITAPLSPVQARRFSERFGAFVLNSYGQAEMGEVIGWTAADARNHPEKLGAAGRPLPGVEIKIEGEGPGGPGEVGQLFVRPPQMTAGYASGDPLADRIDEGGFVATGDLARVDGEGFVWIEGRITDLINRGGNKVFPEEVEEVIRLSPVVDEAGVVGVPDARLGEVPVAFVVAASGVELGELESLCRRHLVPYKVPVDFVLVSTLPKTAVGKLRRAELARQYRRSEPERTRR